MFKHLLLPTDGAQLSETAILNGIQIAKDLGARVTGFHVLPDFHLFTSRAEMLEETRAQFTRDARDRAAQYLDVIERLANMAGVRCDTRCCSGAIRMRPSSELRRKTGATSL